MAATKAAQFIATRFDESDGELREWHVALPVVVTDGVVATARLVEGRIDVTEVDHARVMLKWPTWRGTPAVIVDVVRASALAEFVRGCHMAARILANHAPATVYDPYEDDEWDEES